MKNIFEFLPGKEISPIEIWLELESTLFRVIIGLWRGETSSKPLRPVTGAD
ncbi:MAG TPA: hypothetical protein PKN13_10795 [Accumulibacter sp.]|nr:hypothetical protein [Accumulibacter sp.]HMX21880.1 hypothetical protein [Accumulibacter sp.]HMY06770.1 hypothetical protein [Accumulibacter sp.]HNC18765.1 hypothetical protein [Accumulibacter sp.]HND81105.1 hypothetical protein [Accumulibacter sp.]